MLRKCVRLICGLIMVGAVGCSQGGSLVAPEVPRDGSVETSSTAGESRQASDQDGDIMKWPDARER